MAGVRNFWDAPLAQTPTLKIPNENGEISINTAKTNFLKPNLSSQESVAYT